MERERESEIKSDLLVVNTLLTIAQLELLTTTAEKSSNNQAVDTNNTSLNKEEGCEYRKDNIPLEFDLVPVFPVFSERCRSFRQVERISSLQRRDGDLVFLTHFRKKVTEFQ